MDAVEDVGQVIDEELSEILCHTMWHGHPGRGFSRAGSPCHKTLHSPIDEVVSEDA
jgi:hypothetical protein